MKFYSPFVLALLLVSACGAQVAGPKLKASDLQADAAILRTAYEQLHPGLYRYNTKAQMDGDFDSLSHELDHDQTLEEAFIAFSEFAAKVRCGHTQANPFNQIKAVVEALFQRPTRLPFYFDWLDGHMIVTHDFTPEHNLPAGTEVDLINGVETSAILNKMLPIARADGSNDRKRIAQLAVNGDSLYETFDLYYPMFFPQKNANYLLLVRKPGGAHAEKSSVRPLTFEERIAPIKQREEQRKGGDEAVFEWKYLTDDSAYLRMPTWALYDSKWDWKRWLEEHIDDAVERKAPALILDLRGNEGGDDVGNEIIPHLIDAPIQLSAMSRLVRYRKVPESLIPYLDTWDKSFRDWGKAAVDLREPWPTAPVDVTYLRLSRYDDNGGGDVLKPATKRFSGKVVVLIDSTNSSATFQFAQNIQSHHLGTLIGRPTGGSQRGINGGAFFFLRLPHSNIEMDLPLIATFPAVSMPDAGVTPDVVVEVTPSDIASGYDATLAAATLAIRGGSSEHSKP
jgi:Peptidase family S41